MIRKIIKKFLKYKKRCRNFYSSSVAGLFAGVVIGIFFSLITKTETTNWINIKNYEIFAGIIYFLFTYIILFLLYFFGKLLIFIIDKTFKLKNTTEGKITFKINYFASAYTTIFTTLLILLEKNTKITWTIVLIFILTYFPTMYFVVRNKK